MKLTSFYQKSTKYKAVLSFWNFFWKVPTIVPRYYRRYFWSLSTVPSTGTAGTLIKYRAHFCLLPPSFNNYFTKLDVIHHYNTIQKVISEFFQPFFASETGKNSLQHIRLKIWKNIPEEFKHCSFSSFKKYVKSSAISKYVQNHHLTHRDRHLPR